MLVTAKDVSALLQQLLEDGELPANYQELVTPLEDDGGAHVAKVKSLSKEGLEHQVSIQKLTPQTMDVRCTCPAGVSGSLCRHVAAFYGYLRQHPPVKEAEAQGEQLKLGAQKEKEVSVEPKEAVVEKETEAPQEQTSAVVPKETGPAIIKLAMSPAELTAWREQINAIVDMLQEGVDYGTVPGVSKPFLHQPGADLVNTAFAVYAVDEIIEKEIDHDRRIEYEKVKWITPKEKPTQDEIERLKAEGLGRFRKIKNKWVWQEKQVTRGVSYGLYRFLVRVKLIHRPTGRVVGSGVGACSTLEDKYIERPRNLENTIYQMAVKRAKVNATRATFGLSGRFTQDEDIVSAVAQEGGFNDEDH